MSEIKTSLTSLYPAFLMRKKVLEFVEKWKYHALIKRHQLPLYEQTDAQKLHAEMAMIDMLRRIQEEQSWIPKVLYPIGGATNHALLYLLTRLLAEKNIGNTLELGVGQTTKVLAGYAKEMQTCVCSIDDSSFWVDKFRPFCTAPGHRIFCCPLAQTNSGTEWYDISSVQAQFPNGGFDLVLVDGPVGSAKCSRVGIVDRFLDICAQEWVVIWDDLHRKADLESFVLFLEKVRTKHPNCKASFCVTNKTVGLAYTPKYQFVGYYF